MALPVETDLVDEFDDDYREYPRNLIEDKVRFMTRLLEDRLKQPVTSHRAGRWAFNEAYAKVLLDLGYIVDTSVTPHVSWRAYFGDPKGNGGPDFSTASELPYFVSEQDPAPVSAGSAARSFSSAAAWNTGGSPVGRHRRKCSTPSTFTTTSRFACACARIGIKLRQRMSGLPVDLPALRLHGR